MPIPFETPIATTTANGVTTLFPHSFTVLDKADLIVKTELSGVVSYPVEGVDYTVAGVGSPTGSVTFASPPANGTKVTRYRDTSLERTTDYQENGDLLATTLDADIDRVVMMVQELFAGGKGAPTSIRVPNGETVGELPSAADRALRILSFDSLGAPLLIPGAVSDSAVDLALDLASSVSASKGAGQIGFNSALTYSAGTVGASLKIALALPWASLTSKPTTLSGYGISSSDPLLTPVGSTTDFAGETPPPGWLECDGSSLLRASYPALFSAIGTLHGAADGTHFNIPDHRGRFKRGWSHGTTNDPDKAGRTAAATGGATGDHVGTVQADDFKAHTHNPYLQYHSSTGAGQAVVNAPGVSGPAVFGTTTSAGGNETRPINAAVMSIIKF